MLWSCGGGVRGREGLALAHLTSHAPARAHDSQLSAWELGWECPPRPFTYRQYGYSCIQNIETRSCDVAYLCSIDLQSDDIQIILYTHVYVRGVYGSPRPTKSIRLVSPFRDSQRLCSLSSQQMAVEALERRQAHTRPVRSPCCAPLLRTALLQ